MPARTLAGAAGSETASAGVMPARALAGAATTATGNGFRRVDSVGCELIKD